MRVPARYNAAIDVLAEVMDGKLVAAALIAWQRKNRYAGAKDRAAVRDIVYGALRRRESLQYLGGQTGAKGAIIGAVVLSDLAVEEVFGAEGYAPPALEADALSAVRGLDDLADAPDWVRLDCPQWLYDRVCADLGDNAEGVLSCLQERAPVDLRVNPAKSPRDTVIADLTTAGYTATPLADLPNGVRLSGEVRKLDKTSAFENGAFEPQDAHSQTVVRDMLTGTGLADDAQILDYCAGAGGKALAVASNKPDAQICVYDKVIERLSLLKIRAKRAGVKFTYMADEPLDAQFDLVLADAPCSGSGTWRRDPDGKWKLDSERLDALCAEQRGILAKAAALVGVDGVLSYCTCSVLACENQGQVAQFLQDYPDWECFQSEAYLPSFGDDGVGGDGFFLAQFRKKT